MIWLTEQGLKELLDGLARRLDHLDSSVEGQAGHWVHNQTGSVRRFLTTWQGRCVRSDDVPQEEKVERFRRLADEVAFAYQDANPVGATGRRARLLVEACQKAALYEVIRDLPDDDTSLYEHEQLVQGTKLDEALQKLSFVPTGERPKTGSVEQGARMGQGEKWSHACKECGAAPGDNHGSQDIPCSQTGVVPSRTKMSKAAEAGCLGYDRSNSLEGPDTCTRCGLSWMDHQIKQPYLQGNATSAEAYIWPHAGQCLRGEEYRKLNLKQCPRVDEHIPHPYSDGWCGGVLAIPKILRKGDD
jgi:hypothetical protein